MCVCVKGVRACEGVCVKGVCEGVRTLSHDGCVCV